MTPDARVTRNFALSEFVVSDTATRLGIDNMPTVQIEATLRNVLIPAMQQIRDLLGQPVIIKSGYRCANLNAAVRGAPGSQHCTGHAADFVAPAFGMLTWMPTQRPRFCMPIAVVTAEPQSPPCAT